MMFTVIIPTHKSDGTIQRCIDSIENQIGFGPKSIEVLIIEDVDSEGPGIPRNIGIERATGDWIVFLDSDDMLAPDALFTISQAIIVANPEHNVISYSPHHETEPIEEVLTAYRRHQYDGSVIYTAIRRRTLIEHSIRFAPGYHEDVDFMYKVFKHTRGIHYVNKDLYVKFGRVGSIINTISAKHISGFMRAWDEIGSSISTQEELDDYALGTTNMLATRLREIALLAHTDDYAELLNLLHDLYMDSPIMPDLIGHIPNTQYGMITKKFIHDYYTALNSYDANKVVEYIREIMSKHWSCTDLQGSVFLAPDEIRTCCKRFFVDGKIKGDVALDVGPLDKLNVVKIFDAKNKLKLAINKGVETDCSGCPFLEFKDWEPIKPKVKYLSLEYHSVCNLKCTYCSPTYYDGKQPMYDPIMVVSDLVGLGAISKGVTETVVWGGGEPTIHSGFVPISSVLARIVDKQRVLTNSVKWSEHLATLLNYGKATITTSIDAGSSKKFKEVRGVDKYDKVFDNLCDYAKINGDLVTIKYIFTDLNSTKEDVDGFIKSCREFGLFKCNFQISSDFKQEILLNDRMEVVVYLCELLIYAGARTLYLDDLLRQRLKGYDRPSNIIANEDDYGKVVIFGAGWQAKLMIEESKFFKSVIIDSVVDDTPGKIGRKFCGITVRSSETLYAHDYPIIIAATQAYPAMYDRLMKMGIDKNRIITKLII